MDRISDREYIREYNRLLKACDTVYHNAAVRIGLSDCAFWILYTLQESGRSYTQSEIGETTSMPKQTVNSALKKLEKEGYVSLRRADGRMGKVIHLTEKGMIFAAENLKPVMDAEVRVCAAIPAEEKNMLLDILQHIVGTLNEEMNGV